MAEWIISPDARDDLDAIHGYIAADNLKAADTVLEAAFTTFEKLANTPGLGRERVFASDQLLGLRSFCVIGFRSYLIFYRECATGIEVVRVLHGSRDFRAVFDDDPF